MILPNDLCHDFVYKKQTSPTNKIWPITTFSLSRNLSIAKFVPCLSKEQKQEILEAIVSHFNSIEGYNAFITLPLKEASSWQKEFLLEHFLFPYDLTGNPDGEAFVIHRDGDILAAINCRDHLILHAIDFFSDPETMLSKLVKLECYLNTKLAFSFSSDFGFLTTHPQECGTALSIRCLLHVPALIYRHELEPLIRESSDILYSGAIPSVPEFMGNIVVLSNRYSLGLTEEQIISSLSIWASKLAAAEAAARKKLLEENSPALKNHILRSLGLLTHSCYLDLKEATEALSWVQLGINLGWIQEASSWHPNFWQARRGHLLYTQQPEERKDLQKEKVSQLRASVFKKLAKDLSVVDLQ